MIDRSAEQRRALGDFVRAQRERTVPQSLGLPPGSRRRTPGLRREELAQLCGLSTTWFTWIEQGRDISVSPNALARLANALRLGRAERAYLFDVAGRRDPDRAADGSDAFIAPAVLGCVDAIGSPAYILDRAWTARSWNAAARHLFVGWLDAPAEHRYNLLRFIFLTPSARSLICDWAVRARRVAAEFRAACGAHINDPAWRSLIAELRERSSEFAQFWEQHGVLGREGGKRTFHHPTDGFVHYEQVTFDLASQSDVKLTMLVAPERIQRVGTGLSPR